MLFALSSRQPGHQEESALGVFTAVTMTWAVDLGCRQTVVSGHMLRKGKCLKAQLMGGTYCHINWGFLL